MLTDIFANRYINITLWETFKEADRRLLVYGFRIISGQFFPYCREDPYPKTKWEVVHDKLSMELGVEELSQQFYWGATECPG